MARSQPNLLEALDVELEYGDVEEEVTSPGILREKWNSNPNLLDDEDTASQSSLEVCKVRTSASTYLI